MILDFQQQPDLLRKHIDANLHFEQELSKHRTTSQKEGHR